MMLIIRILSIILRFILYRQNIFMNFAKFLNFNILPFSQVIFKENIFLQNEFSNSDITNIQGYSFLFQKFFFSFIDNEFFALFVLSIIDVVIGKSLASLKVLESQESRNNLVEIFYLFNPFTIAHCLSLSFDKVYFLFVILSFIHMNDDYGPYIFSFALIFNTSGLFNIIGLILFLLCDSREKFSKKGFIIRTFLFYLLMLTIQGILVNFKQNPIQHQINYFLHIETLPNFSVVSGYMNSVFLKYIPLSKAIVLIYQIALNLSNIALIRTSLYINKYSLFFTMNFTVNLICEKACTINDLVILLILLIIHQDIFKLTTSFEISPYFIFAGFILIYSRGFAYYYSISGSSHFVFFQAFTFSIFTTVVHLMNIFAVRAYQKRHVSTYASSKILNEILDVVSFKVNFKK